MSYSREDELCDIMFACGINAMITVSGVAGMLGDFTFERTKDYWEVHGNVPIAIARELFANPIGRKHVRVSGHTGGPSLNENGVEIINDEPFVILYYIDSVRGLDLFVKTLKKHDLV